MAAQGSKGRSSEASIVQRIARINKEVDEIAKELKVIEEEVSYITLNLYRKLRTE